MSTRQSNASAPIILDLDGVITRTANLHRIAWKRTFDAFLRDRHPDQRPFDPDSDYPRHVDGKPRLDGVRAFLASRDIELPEGDDADTVDDATVRGIGNTKNRRFHELLDEIGPEVFPDAAERIKAWRRSGRPVAVVSSSRNCKAVLDAVDMTDDFDARVDGETLADLGLDGKPAPDMFLEAARRLDAEPADCVVLEDAESGVQAAARGGFGLVIGVDRSGNRGDRLREHGAHRVVRSLSGLDPEPEAGRNDDADGSHHARLLPDAFADFEHALRGRTPALFLDYDGTLTPIVDHPEDADLDDAMRDLLREAGEHLTVAVVSGRDRPDVQSRVALDSLVYAGSHGYDIEGPDLDLEHEAGRKALPDLDRAGKRLRASLDGVRGAQVERKRFAIAVHYRNAAEDDRPAVEEAVDEALKSAGSLKRSDGKAVIELRPDADWDKGRAVMWLCDALDLEPDRTAPVYIGDDTTDEDAFRALRKTGVGILVSEDDRQTDAAFRLRDVGQVRDFLRRLIDEHAPTEEHHA